MLLKREREQHPRSSGQPPPKLLQQALPYQKLHQSLRIAHHQYPVREDTTWPSTGKMSGSLFEDRNWLLTKNYLVTENKNESMTGVTSPRPALKEEPKREEQIISPKAEKCRWGPDCPFCKSQKKEEENKQQQKTSPDVPKPQAKRPNTLSLNMTKTKQQWEAEMERLNSKYNLDCSSDSEIDSESDEENSIRMSMGMRHLSEKYQNVENVKTFL